jgi:hypothetical protein
MELTREIGTLFSDQLKSWELARSNYADLQYIRIKAIPFEGFKILVQFNPKRIISSSARVDPQSISARPCFLCKQNRPLEQESILYRDRLLLLVNPYPVFGGHLTVPSIGHEPQRILSNFDRMLEIARDLPQNIIIYNGPQCGASAPDHFHFQAIRKGHMPIEDDFIREDRCKKYTEYQSVAVHTWNKYLRELITLQGKDTVVLESVFGIIYRFLQQEIGTPEEPMMNILAGYYQDHWVIHLFPRKLHRPDQYFATGKKQLLISPASIDMGGVLIMPREEDFIKITREDIEDVFRQVCIKKINIQRLLKEFQ